MAFPNSHTPAMPIETEALEGLRPHEFMLMRPIIELQRVLMIGQMWSMKSSTELHLR
jgi:hypothetical protein